MSPPKSATIGKWTIPAGTDVLWYVLGGDVSIGREVQIELAAPTGAAS